MARLCKRGAQFGYNLLLILGGPATGAINYDGEGSPVDGAQALSGQVAQSTRRIVFLEIENSRATGTMFMKQLRRCPSPVEPSPCICCL
jgi:hypothetical protein